jgi:hypothetical protein
MEVLVVALRAFFFGLLGAAIPASIFYFVWRRKPDVSLVLGAAVGIGKARAIEALWPLSSGYEPAVLCACVALFVGLAKLWRGAA